MVFTIGQAVTVTENSVSRSGTILRLNPLGSKDSYVVRFSDNSQKAFFGNEASKIAAA